MPYAKAQKLTSSTQATKTSRGAAGTSLGRGRVRFDPPLHLVKMAVNRMKGQLKSFSFRCCQ
eukprot:2145460-Amphidinium_carterae.1